MKVILVSDVKNVGKKGDVVDVSEGYATNFLIKKGLAILQNKANLNDLIRQRNNLYYKRQHELKIENKDDISKQIEAISQKIIDIRYKIKMCADIEVRSKKMIEEMKALQEKKQQEKVQKKNKVKKL